MDSHVAVKRRMGRKIANKEDADDAKLLKTKSEFLGFNGGFDK